MPGAADLESLLRFWRAQDDLFDRVDLTWWGAVVSDPRYPHIQEPNYARVETTRPVALAEVEAELLPALDRSGCRRPHVVVFFPEEQTDLLAEASTRGERLTWDLVMEHRSDDPRRDDDAERDDPVEEVTVFDDRFWRDHRRSARHFEIHVEHVLDELQAMERDLMIPAGRRWFVVREPSGTTVAFAALLALEGVAFIDHVVTLPSARRRGLATAVTRRILAEVRAAGVERTFLLAEPEGIAARMYARLGFENVSHLASWLAPLDEAEGSQAGGAR